MLLLAVTSGAAWAEPTLPFNGRLQAQEQYDVAPPLMYVDTSGSGNGTHLGAFGVTWQFTVNLVSLEAVGVSQFVAANGDLLFAEGTGIATPVQAPDIFLITEEYVIVGGTGRFEGSTGSYVVERLVNTTTGTTSGSFEGSITLNKGH